jgi:hypothetical protein
MTRKTRKPGQMFMAPMELVKHPDTHRIVCVKVELFGGKKQKPVVLAYDDVAQARVQRRILLKAGNVIAVPSARLAAAIKQALNEARLTTGKPVKLAANAR